MRNTRPETPTTGGAAGPGPDNIGVPAGIQITDCTGPYTITADNTVFDAKNINCDLSIQFANVTITRSKITGSVGTAEDSTGYSFSIWDSFIDVGQRGGTGIGAVNYTAARVQVVGGNRSFYCWHDCTVTDSYVHGQMRDSSGTYHESGMRMSASTTYRHNSIICDAPTVPPNAGCSADLTGYGDFATLENNTIDRNLFGATTGGYCTYGGSSSSKPYPDANQLVFTDNVFQRGNTPSDHGEYVCGGYGAVVDFDPNAPGNARTKNTFDDGSVLAAN